MALEPLLVVAVIAGYFVGSVSFAVLIARMKGLDIFKVGSGNPGATNVLRTLGKPYGYACFLLDTCKGAVAVLLGIGIGQATGGAGEALAIAALLGAILGHSFSLFLRFRGGKGVATTIGGLLVLLPVVLLVGLVLWVLVFYAGKYVSLASLVLGASLPLTAWASGRSDLMIGLCLFLAVLIFVRHIANIRRLFKGTEPRAGQKRP